MSASRSSLRALVVGTGFGCRVHVPALRAAGFDIVGLVGTDMERTARRAKANGIPHCFVDLDDAIAKTGAVVVTVATPPGTHAALAIAALSRGCHVVCEKPFARDLTEARAMLAAARRAGTLHLVGHEFRWTPEQALMGRAIAEGMIGAPRFATLTLYVPLVASPEARMPRWWFDREAGGGWLGASGSHVVDQLRSWFGEFASVSAALPVLSVRENSADDSFVVRFRLANGVEGVMQGTGGAWGPITRMTRVAGTDGTLWLEDGAVMIADRQGARMLPVPAELMLPPPPPADGDPQHHTHLELGPYTRLCQALRAGIEGRAMPGAVPLPTFADGLACMEVLDAIRASAASDGAVIAVGSR